MTILSLMAGFHPTYTSRCSTFIPRFLFPSFAFVVEFWVCLDQSHPNISHSNHNARRSPHDFLFPSFEFVVDFWVCLEWSHLNIPHTHYHAQRSFHDSSFPSFGFVLEFWVCLVWSHPNIPYAHTSMLNAHPTFFCFRVLGLLSIFGLVWIDLTSALHTHARTHARTRAHTHIHTHHNAQRSPHEFLFPSFGFVGTNLTRCTKKKLYLSSFSIPILIFNFSTQMRYRWNRYHSQIVNIVFLNYLVQNKLF